VTATIGIEHEYFEAVLSLPKAAESPILAAISPSYYTDPEKFLENRTAILESECTKIHGMIKLTFSHLDEYRGSAKIEDGMGKQPEIVLLPMSKPSCLFPCLQR